MFSSNWPNASTRTFRVSSTTGSDHMSLLSHELFRRANHRWLVPAVATSLNDGTLNRSVRDVSTIPSQQILHTMDGRKCNVCHIGEDSRRQPSCGEQFRHEQLGGWRSG